MFEVFSFRANKNGRRISSLPEMRIAPRGVLVVNLAAMEMLCRKVPDDRVVVEILFEAETRRFGLRVAESGRSLRRRPRAKSCWDLRVGPALRYWGINDSPGGWMLASDAGKGVVAVVVALKSKENAP